ncbi:MAG TPA: amino acid ABC transporter permease [Mycobacteriales bacterium]|jgi:polar amino acid transport system permease protein|nr:amino acid ABC transporter permease [Mycobacteriales bacterium]
MAGDPARGTDDRPSETGREAATGPEVIRAIPVRHPGRWVAAAVIALLLAMLIHSLFTNPNWQWGIVRQNFAKSTVIHGIGVTLELTVLAMLVGVVLGAILAVMRLSPNPVVSGAAWAYVWFFRGTPVLVQIIFWSFLAALYPFPSLGVPFGPEFVTFDANKLIPLFVGAVLGLGLNEAAYMSEIVRAGILSVDEGQTEAAHALGMRRLLVLRRIVLPQAMRVIVPPTGNETISMLKTTSLVSIIAVVDLLKAVQNIYGSNYKYIPLLLVASIWYVIMTSVLSVAQYYLERRFARGSSRALPPTPVQRVRARLRRTVGSPT